MWSRMPNLSVNRTYTCITISKNRVNKIANTMFHEHQIACTTHNMVCANLLLASTAQAATPLTTHTTSSKRHVTKWSDSRDACSLTAHCQQLHRSRAVYITGTRSHLGRMHNLLANVHLPEPLEHSQESNVQSLPGDLVVPCSMIPATTVVTDSTVRGVTLCHISGVITGRYFRVATPWLLVVTEAPCYDA